MMKQVMMVFFVLVGAAYGQFVNESFSFTQQAIPFPVNRVGMFIGCCGEALVVGGGLDESGKPSAAVYVSPDGKGQQWRSFTLQAPVAFGASVSGGDGKIYIAGGLTDEGVSNKVQVLQWKPDLNLASQKQNTDLPLIQKMLPPLPKAVVLAGAGFLDNQLYVVGGLASEDSADALRDVYRMKLIPSAKGPQTWDTLPLMPGEGRIMPGVIGFYNDIHVFGGWNVSRENTSLTYRPLSTAVAYRWKPVDGTTSLGWRDLAPIPEALAAPVLIQTGQVHVVLAGGFSKPFTGSILDPRAMPVPGESMFAYHNVTDTWIEKGKLPQPLAMATVVKLAKTFLILGGVYEAAGVTAYDVALKRTVRNLSALDYTVLVSFFSVTGLIGVVFARKQKSTSEFALGNRNVKWWAAGISMFAAGASSISFMAIPALAFRSNLVWVFPIGILIPMFFLQAYVIYPIMRRLELTSTYEYLARRFHPSLRYIASAQCIVFQVLGRMTMVLLLPAIAISAVTGLDKYTSVLVMGVLTTIYASTGGIEAVIWNDVIQGTLKLMGAALIIVLAITGLQGGFREFVDISLQFHKFDYAIWSPDYTNANFWFLVIAPMVVVLAFAGDQPIVQRVFSTPLKDVRKLAGIFTCCSILISVLVNFAGIAVFAYFRANPSKLDIGMANDQIIPLYIVQRLPTGVAGIIISTLFAAAMSTLASSMNSSATVFTEDFYRKFRKNTSDKERLIVMKLGTLVAGCIGVSCALYMAGLDLLSLFKTWNEMVALLGGGFLGIYILGMFTRRANAIGAIAGAVCSIIITVLVKKFTLLHWSFYSPCAVFSCMFIGYLTSIIFPIRQNLNGLTMFDMKTEYRKEAV
jgi:SSS family solute:Na+ symporter